jgi:magnesium transporter
VEVETVLDQIRKYLDDTQVDQAIDVFDDLPPADQADIIEALDEEQVQILVSRLPTGDLADIFAEMEDYDAAELAEDFTPEALAAIMDEMEPDDAADVLGDVKPKFSASILKFMQNSEAVQQLMTYPDNTAGGTMTTELLLFGPETLTREVWTAIRETRTHGIIIPYVFVVNENRQLLGIIGPMDLICAVGTDPLEQYMNRDVLTVNVQDDRELAARLMTRYDLVALPVLDERKRLVGAITFDDALATMEKEAAEDMLNRGAISTLGGHEMARSQVLVRGPIWKTMRVRIPFLLITMAGGLMAGGVISVFEEAVQAVVALAIFIPVVMDMGGNVGTQSSTIFARGTSLGQININRIGKVLGREVLVGLGMGIILGLVAGLIAYFWQGIPEVGLVVGISLVLTMTLAATLGFFVPFLLVKAGADMAAGADPIITTIKDVTGLLIYFWLAHLFMSAML